jgi:hypothetical protein
MYALIKNCLDCGEPLKGRIDKKFCDDYCRNRYNNLQKVKSTHNKVVRTINNFLLRNRRILENLLPPGEYKMKANRDLLQQEGFHFKYITHSSTNKVGKTCFYCYDYGYMPLDNDWFLLVRRKEDQ